MTQEEAYTAMDYWDNEIQRSQNYIYECQENIQQIKEQMQSSQTEGWYEQ